MPEKVMTGPVSDFRGILEAVCIHTRKIYDSCREKEAAASILFGRAERQPGFSINSS